MVYKIPLIIPSILDLKKKKTYLTSLLAFCLKWQQTSHISTINDLHVAENYE